MRAAPILLMALLAAGSVPTQLAGSVPIHTPLTGSVPTKTAGSVPMQVPVGGCYTNHAGLVMRGVPVKVEAKYVTLSNASEVVRLPFSIFPERERRRLAADGGSVQFIPMVYRRAVEGEAKQERRAANRVAKKLATPESQAPFVARARAALKRSLDAAESSGDLLPAERRLLTR